MKAPGRFFLLIAVLAMAIVSLTPAAALAWTGPAHEWAARQATSVYGLGYDPYRVRIHYNSNIVGYLGLADIRRQHEDPPDAQFPDLLVEPPNRPFPYVPIWPELGGGDAWWDNHDDCTDNDCSTWTSDWLYFPFWQWVHEGSVHQDAAEKSFYGRHHFWMSDYGLHHHTWWWYDEDNAWELAQHYWIHAVDFWNAGQLAQAYSTLGYVMHLVQDMGIPCHANGDMHSTSDEMEDHFVSDANFALFYAGTSIPPFPPPILNFYPAADWTVPRRWLTNMEIYQDVLGWEWGPSDIDGYFDNPVLMSRYNIPQFFQIMLLTNQIGSYFASDQVDGNRYAANPFCEFNWLNYWLYFPGENWLNAAGTPVWPQDRNGIADNIDCTCDGDGDMSKIFMWAYRAAFNASVDVMELFRKTVDHVPPVTSYTITDHHGTPIERDHWTNQKPVTVRLTGATDYSNYYDPVDSTYKDPTYGWRTSGVWATFALVDGKWPTDPLSYPNQPGGGGTFWIVDSRGWHTVEFMSTDMMGNVEESNFGFGIDQIIPSLDMIGMQSVYDFSKQLNVAFSWAAADLHSGMARSWAFIDGVTPVANGQSFVTRDLGIGPHVLSVYAEDNVGNQVALEYPFQVTYKPNCGNGVLNPGEACDDGNAVNGDGCDSNCTVSACGNGIRTGTEECDGTAYCDPDCTCSTGYVPDPDSPGFCMPPVCGNGRVEAGEACDDGNAVNGDGCDDDCTVSACGNGIIAGAEVCDNGAANGIGQGLCLPDCSAVQTCADIDGDGWGTGKLGNAFCPGGTAVDRNDADPAVHPGATETCDGVDNNSDCRTDEGCYGLQAECGGAPCCYTLAERGASASIPAPAFAGEEKLKIVEGLAAAAGPFTVTADYDQGDLVECTTGRQAECGVRLYKWCDTDGDACWTGAPQWVDVTDRTSYRPGLRPRTPVGLDYANNRVTGVVDGNSTLAVVKTDEYKWRWLRLVSPNGGELVVPGAVKKITWGAGPAHRRFSLHYSVDGGQTWKRIKRGLKGSRRSYRWTVPDLGATYDQCLVKVRGYNRYGRLLKKDRSDRVFRIEPEQ